MRLEDAEIIVSGGRGLGGPEAFGDLEQLAGLLGAAVGSSRAACDLGWYPPSQQVGLTGTVVSPTLYLAIAISGASQHMAGCGGSKNIVAINKDRTPRSSPSHASASSTITRRCCPPWRAPSRARCRASPGRLPLRRQGAEGGGGPDSPAWLYLV